jgi:hypothetical protein
MQGIHLITCMSGRYHRRFIALEAEIRREFWVHSYPAVQVSSFHRHNSVSSVHAGCQCHKAVVLKGKIKWTLFRWNWCYLTGQSVAFLYMISRSLSPHDASSGCEWRNGLQYGQWLRIYWISSCGQPTSCGLPVWGLSEVLTTYHSKSVPLTKGIHATWVWTGSLVRSEQWKGTWDLVLVLLGACIGQAHWQQQPGN